MAVKLFPGRKNLIPIALVAILAVAIVSGTGLLAPLTRVIGRVSGSIMAQVRKLFSLGRRGTERAA